MQREEKNLTKLSGSHLQTLAGDVATRPQTTGDLIGVLHRGWVSKDRIERTSIHTHVRTLLSTVRPLGIYFLKQL